YLLDRGRSRRQGRQRTSLLSSASDRLPRVVTLEFAPGQCQVSSYFRLPCSYLAACKLALLVGDRSRLTPLPLANLTLHVALLLAILVPLGVRQTAAFGDTR